MFTRQTATRTEFEVRIKGLNGYPDRFEYRLTRERAEALRHMHEVISITEVTRTLDF